LKLLPLSLKKIAKHYAHFGFLIIDYANLCKLVNHNYEALQVLEINQNNSYLFK